jgi:Flp pilus assembly protein TadD
VLALLGEALQVAGLPEQAVDFLRKAQQRHPDDFWINHHLAYVLFVRLGRPADALGYFRAALALRPGSPGVHFNLGYVLLRQGDLRGAAGYFRRAVTLDPKYVAAHSTLGHVLQALGDLPGAVASYRRAVALDPKVAASHYNLGNALWLDGDRPAAAASYRRVLRLDPNYAEAHCNLGHVLLRQGDFRPALAAFRAGDDLGSRRKGWNYPSPQWVRWCQRLVELDGRLPAIRKGKDRPADAAERLELADLCHYKGLHATCVRFFTEAAVADPGEANDLAARHRYRAACSAALAGCGRGKDVARLDAAARARQRRLALHWLRAELAGRARALDGGTPREKGQVQLDLRAWQRERALAGVRDADALAALPSAERAGWEKLWADVAATLAKTGYTK